MGLGGGGGWVFLGFFDEGLVGLVRMGWWSVGWWRGVVSLDRDFMGRIIRI